MKWVCKSRIPRGERRNSLNTSVSRKIVCLDDISKVNLIKGWNKLAKLTKIEASSIGMFHKENMSMINLFQTKGFSGLATSSHFSRSAMKITEKATAMTCVCTKCFSLNLKEFSLSISHISSRKSLVEIDNFC